MWVCCANNRSPGQWRSRYPAMVRQLERDVPELLHLCALQPHVWRKVRTTNVHRALLRRDAPPHAAMVVLSNVKSVERIIDAIFSRFNQDWTTHTLNLILHKQFAVTSRERARDAHRIVV